MGLEGEKWGRRGFAVRAEHAPYGGFGGLPAEERALPPLRCLEGDPLAQELGGAVGDRGGIAGGQELRRMARWPA